MRSRIASVVVVLLIVVAAVFAQSQRGEIAGVVRDVSGSVLPGVTVQARGPASVEQVRTAVTDARGVYSFKDLPPGAYELTFALIGFETTVLHVTLGNARTELNASLRIGSLAETVTVTGETPTYDQSRVASSVGSGLGSGIGGGTGGGTYAPSAAGPNYRAPIPDYVHRSESFNTEAYDRRDENGFRRVGTDPLSTFSIDVDTASYANVRRFLNSGQLPPTGAVRIEELINYFRFEYPQPRPGASFSVTTEVSECPWDPRHRLALIGVQAAQVAEEDAVPRNLVFLIDVSGSMMPPDKLPLLRQAMRMLVDVLTERDRVAIVVYAGASGLVLPSTPGDHKATIGRALAELEAGGSTNGAAGIELAYRVARDNFIRGGVNRVILATDGDFNVGVSSQDGLVRLIERERQSGVFLSVLGVGTGNLKDSTMEKLADYGNGNYSYLDSLHEARKVLVHEAGGTLTTVAKDVKIQVEFNPKTVAAYRLIGYENRVLRNEDFNDDRKDAGDMGAGHSVTALYEIVPPGADVDAPSVDALKYQQPARVRDTSTRAELMTVKIRYKEPDGDTSRLLSAVVRNDLERPSRNLGFASAVAEFGMLLSASSNKGGANYQTAVARARKFVGPDLEGYRSEFIELAQRASDLARGRPIAARE
jgi:Ca-activated chloride channel homolog